jgi:probable rRNA maturation factor
MIEIDFESITKTSKETNALEKLTTSTLERCFKAEKLNNNLILNVILTNNATIQKYNEKYRKIDKATDVLSFPMFEKHELEGVNNSAIPEVLGDIIVSLEKVSTQAKEYEHSFEREFAYMLVHGFYHIMGFDHMNEADKSEMRAKEEAVLA